MKSAYATLRGFEALQTIKKEQIRIWRYQEGIRGEACLVERAFGIGQCGMADVMEQLNKHFTAWPKNREKIRLHLKR